MAFAIATASTRLSSPLSVSLCEMMSTTLNGGSKGVAGTTHKLLTRSFTSASAGVPEHEADALSRRLREMADADAASMLVDGYGRRHTYLRVSLTERCNLRCTYCMPAEGNTLTPGPRLIQVNELQRLAALFVRGGVRKLRLTGGEPTLRRDIVSVARMLKREVGVPELAITTNGILMGSQGGDGESSDGRKKGKRLLEGLVDAGVTGFNVSLDSLRPERFATLSRTSERGLERVLRGIEMAASMAREGAGDAPLKLKVNVVVMKGINDDEVGDFVQKFAMSSTGLNVRFIEYMPFDQNGWNYSKMVPQKAVMQTVLETLGASGHSLVRLDTGRSAVGTDYDVLDNNGSSTGRVSFVSSMTDKFCSGCNRLRLLADGSLKVCLFSDETDETSLRDLMRSGASDGDLSMAIKGALMKKKAAHAGMFELQSRKNRSMTSIGG